MTAYNWNPWYGPSFFFRSCFIEMNLWNIKNVLKKKLNFFMKIFSIFLSWDFFFEFSRFSRNKDRAQSLFWVWMELHSKVDFFFRKMLLTFFLRGVMAPYLMNVFLTPSTFFLKQSCIFAKKKMFFSKKKYLLKMFFFIF